MDDSGITTYDLAEGKKGVSFQSQGVNPVWYGGKASVVPGTSRGHKLWPNQTLVYKNVRKAFTIGFRCDTGESCTLAIVNHD